MIQTTAAPHLSPASSFPSGFDARTYYQSSTHEEALARLEFLVESRQRLGLLLGDWGYGKSLLLEHFARQLSDKRWLVARVNLLGLSAEELLADVLRQWQRPVEATGSLRWLHVELEDQLSEAWYLGRQPVILADDAGDAAAETLAELARLAQRPSGGVQPTIILATRPELLRDLGRRLLEIAELRIELRPWDLADVRGFLRTSLDHLGRTSPTFSADAVERLHQLSHGVPRSVQQIANLALLATIGGRHSVVDSNTIEAVVSELSVTALAG